MLLDPRIRISGPDSDVYCHCRGLCFIDSDTGIDLNTLNAGFVVDGICDCSSINGIFHAAVQIDTEEAFYVSKVERITCTNIRRDVVGVLDQISLDISL